MLISSNKLKEYIKDSDKIDFLNIWDTFTIRTAEVENVNVVGNHLKDVVVAEIIEHAKHPQKDKYNLLKVSDGKDTYNVLCGAPNCRNNLKVAFVKPGGSIGDFVITEKEIAGFLSQGMCCSLKELGVGEDHSGIVELPTDAPIGMDITEYLPIKDIIVEIDNKSLTNRPDLWGHYGIAREVAAITNHELLPLELATIPEDLEEFDIKIKDKELCSRFCGLRVDNVTVHKSPLNMQIFLAYTGMRSISLLVDISNYIMLELGQPNHAYDARKVKSIEVALAKKGDTFETLDGSKRVLSDEMLMIKNEKEYIGVAGVMGGKSSEIEDDTTDLFLEAAVFDAGSIRKTAIALGLRTEASARFEKSLDPNMADIAIKRFAYFLEQTNPDIKYVSKLTDNYPKVLKEPKIDLPKNKLNVYLGFEIKDELVIKILESLGMQVKVLKDKYTVTVPTFRATKDISIAEDLIEEIARIYGFENLNVDPLNLDLTFIEHENIVETEIKVKTYLTTKYDLNEVHTYLWQKSKFLNKLNIELENPSLVGKTKDNILRDDLSLSLLEVANENLKHTSTFGIYELGTIISNNKNVRVLSILLTEDEKNVKETYIVAKDIAYKIFKTFKNIDIEFKKTTSRDYFNNNVSYEIVYNNNSYGMINMFNSRVSNAIGKKKCFVVVEINFDEFMNMDKELHLYKDISKYPTVHLDYTIIMSKDNKYEVLDNILKDFKSSLIFGYKLIDTYQGDSDNKYTIRYTVGSYDKTLENDELNTFKEEFIKHIKNNNLNIVE